MQEWIFRFWKMDVCGGCERVNDFSFLLQNLAVKQTIVGLVKQCLDNQNDLQW